LLIGERLAHLNQQVANKNVEKEPHQDEDVKETIGCNLGFK
jgi:hypothetical protein